MSWLSKTKNKIKKIGKKNLIIGGTVLLLLIGGGMVGDSLQKAGIKKDIKRYLQRVEKYPSESENYQKLSELFEKLKQYDKAEQYYDMAKQAEALSKETDKSKRLAQLQKLIELARQNDGNFGSRTGSVGNNNNDSQTDSPKISNDKDAFGSGHLNLKKLDTNTKDAQLKKAIQAYNQAQKYYQKKQLDKALDKLKEAISHKKDFVKPYSLMGNVYLDKDMEKEALEAAKKTISLDPKDSNAYFVQGEVYLEYQDTDQAEENYRQAIELDDQNYMSFYRLAGIRYRQGKFNEAKDLYEKCLAIKKDFLKALINLSFCYFNLNNTLVARQVLVNALKIPSIQNDANILYHIYSTLGFFNKNLKDYREAVNYLEKAIQLKQKVNNYLLLGICYEELNQLGKAKESYMKASALDSKNTEAAYNYGTVLMKENNYQEAVAKFREVIAIKPSYIKAYINAGISMLKLGDDNSAKQYFEEALKLNKNHSVANIELAKYWQNNSIMDKAVYHAKIAINNEKGSRRKAAYLNELGLIYMAFKLNQEALSVFEEAKKLDILNLDTLKSIAKIHTDEQNWEAAKNAISVIIKIDKKAYSYYENLGLCYIKLKQPKKAKEIFQTLLTKNPSYANRSRVEEYLNAL